MKQRAFGSTGFVVPIIGQGTWPTTNRDALRRGIDLGMTHIDTAEMYGRGRSEEVVGEAIASYDRSSLFIVSKIVPSNAHSKASIAKACDATLRRLDTDYLDCYLLHWRGDTDLGEAMRGLEALVEAGKIRCLGVSNFDPWDLREANGALSNTKIACNQVLYNLDERTPESHEIPWSREHECAFVAYTPLGRTADVEGDRLLAEIAKRHRVTREAIALAFVVREPYSFAIPKASTIAHVEANAAAGDVELDAAEIAAIDAAYPLRERVGPLPMN